MWAGWRSLWEGEEAPHVLAAVRILLGLVLLYDFLSMASLGLVEPLFSSIQDGGWSVSLVERPPPLFTWLPDGPVAAWTVWGTMLACTLAFTVGLRPQVAALVLVLLWAQLRVITPGADRGIDTLARNVLLIMACSGAGEAWSVEAWFRPLKEQVSSWPRRLILVQLVAMYFLAGIQKNGFAWYPPGHFAALYFVLQDPAIARFDMSFVRDQPFFVLTQLGTAVTLLFQDSYPLVLLFRYLRWTAERGGRLRAWANRFPFEWVWVGTGAFFHLALAVTTELGIFPWAMMALYPVWLHPREARALWGRLRGA
mgnify:FL=1